MKLPDDWMTETTTAVSATVNSPIPVGSDEVHSNVSAACDPFNGFIVIRERLLLPDFPGFDVMEN